MTRHGRLRMLRLEWSVTYSADRQMVTCVRRSDGYTETIPTLRYNMEMAMAAWDFSTPEGRARAAAAAVDVVAEHPNELVRDPYLVEISDRCRVETDSLRTLCAMIRQAART